MDVDTNTAECLPARVAAGISAQLLDRGARPASGCGPGSRRVRDPEVDVWESRQARHPSSAARYPERDQETPRFGPRRRRVRAGAEGREAEARRRARAV